MNRRIFLKNAAGALPLLPLGMHFSSCLTKGEEYYGGAEDFAAIPKVDAHYHYDTFNEPCLQYAASVNMHLLTINVDAGEDLDKQLAIGETFKKKYPDRFDFLGAFSVAGFGSATFADDVIARVKRCMDAGARGVKIWKNIGMELLDADGKYVMADHPAFDPVYAYLEKESIPMVAHLGEPRNCWLPYERITMGGDLNYYTQHPEYHMYQHPEAPTYEAQMAARDHILEKFPRLMFVGAHIGSMEWSLDEVARRFERYPNFHIDLSARFGHVQLHTMRDYKKVRDFFIRYRDRILYGSDTTLDDRNTQNAEERCRAMYGFWLRHWMFLTTEERLKPADEFIIPDPPDKIRGLKLPKKVVDKIYLENFKRIFG
jgi:predicted TIM-barrel fold metal-dependent hydrolase